MICRICGAEMQETITDLPFKLGDKNIVIVRDLPVLQCSTCPEYLLSDPVMEKLEAIFAEMNRQSELEIVKFAA